ncbi:hypothetical protein Tcan_04066 [Toxocara canis]|uniref:Uncharacterized protein n=1 Tax=Toxocara canis TaxID=6265 RepID=A0A0B2VYD0_TOXCA|nr:hypothetical protein Tcan_04066 [Toxocara canis]
MNTTRSSQYAHCPITLLNVRQSLRVGKESFQDKGNIFLRRRALDRRKAFFLSFDFFRPDEIVFFFDPYDRNRSIERQSYTLPLTQNEQQQRSSIEAVGLEVNKKKTTVFEFNFMTSPELENGRKGAFTLFL